MSKYDYNNIEFSMAVSNIKSSLYDVISSINGNIFSLDEELKDNNDPTKEALKNKLEIELKNLISLSEQIERKISSIDKLLIGNDIEVKEEVEINTEENDEDNINLDNKQIIPDQINENEEVELSEKAINDLYKEEDTNSVEEVAESSVVNPVIEIPVSDNKEEKTEETTPQVETPVEEKPVAEEAPATEDKKEETTEPASTETTSQVEAPVEEKSVAEEASTTEEKKEDTTEPVLPEENTPQEESPVEEKSVEEAPVTEEKTEEVVADTPAEESTAPTEEKKDEVSLEGTGLKIPGIENTEESKEDNIPVPVVENEKKPEETTSEKSELDSLSTDNEPVKEEKGFDNSNIKYMVSKTTNDPSKAIIVTNNQFNKLLASHDTQRSLSKFRNLFKLDNTQHDDVNLEEMMNKANELYKSGDVKGAEALYNKISEINESRNS